MMNLRPFVFRSGACVLGATLLLLTPPRLLAADKVREEIHQTYPFAAEGRLEVANVNGRVEIQAWDRHEVKLDAVKVGESQAAIDAVKVEIDAKSDRLKIVTRHPSGKAWRKGNNSRVDYTLSVPAGTRLDEVSSVNGPVRVVGVQGRSKISTVNGPLEAKGLAADAELSSVNGKLEAEFASVAGVEKVSAKTVNGSVTLRMPAKLNASFDVDTVNGSIRAGYGLQEKKHWPVGHELKAQLGEGGPKVRVNSVNGAVTIESAKGE